VAEGRLWVVAHFQTRNQGGPGVDFMKPFRPKCKN
jgi:hypothetical protein